MKLSLKKCIRAETFEHVGMCMQFVGPSIKGSCTWLKIFSMQVWLYPGLYVSVTCD